MMRTGPLRVGLIGAGAIARAHLPAYAFAPDKVALRAVFDVDPQASAAVAATLSPPPRIHEDLRELLTSADLDAVDICAPHDQHQALAVAAAGAGKHVLLEKPMACSMAECHAIVEACERAGVTLMIGQSLRHVASYRGAKALIEAGRLGPIWSGSIEEFLPSDSERQARPTRTWYTDAARAGGGVLITQATHHIDLFRYLLGEVERVTARIWTDNPAYRNGAEDSAVATLEFQGGIQVQLRASNSVRMQRFHFSILGEDGMIFTHAPDDASPLEKHQAPAFASLREQGPAAIRPGVGLEVAPPIPLTAPAALPSENAFVNEILHFADCCREGLEPISSGRDNLATMAALFALYASARSGGTWIKP